MRTSGAGVKAGMPYFGRAGKSRLSRNRRRVLARRQAHIRRTILRGAYETLRREGE